MKKCMIIYNPLSGKQLFKKNINLVINRLTEQNFHIDVRETKKARHAEELAIEACNNLYDLLVISGGDGTVNECINGMAVCSHKPKIGYIPTGTSCDLASTLKIPKNIHKALDIILNGEVAKMDIVKNNNRFFIYVAAIGSYTSVSYVTDSKMKKYFGWVAYALTGLKELFSIPIIKTTVEHDKGVIKGYFSLIMVVNSKKVAGFKIIDKPILNDGKVDLVLYRYIPFLNNLIYFISFILTPKVLPGVKKIQTSKVNIKTDSKEKWVVDGEEGTKGNQDFVVVSQGVNIIINSKIKKKLFLEE